MKKILAAITVVVLGAGTAMAAGPMGGPGGCMGPGMTGPNAAAYKKHISETMPLRQEMMNKHFELEKEWVKEKPDAAVVSKLQGEIGELRAKIRDARTKAGLPMGPKGHRGHKGHKMHKGGGMGGGMMGDCPYMATPPAPAAK